VHCQNQITIIATLKTDVPEVLAGKWTDMGTLEYLFVFGNMLTLKTGIMGMDNKGL